MSRPTMFDRVLVGVDGTAYGEAALVQALALAPDGAAVRAVTALDLVGVAQTGWEAARFAETLAAAAEEARAAAAALLADRPGGEAVLVKGGGQTVLRREIDAFAPTLIALGGRSRSRLLGAFLGETASMLLHEMSASVLLARPCGEPPWRPERLVVGLDGSDASLTALAAADDLAARLGARVSVVAATGGKPVGEGGDWTSRVTEWDSGSPVDALCVRSSSADLLVVGSRGLHGVRALGSVSERVAHRAACSVLVVRAP